MNPIAFHFNGRVYGKYDELDLKKLYALQEKNSGRHESREECDILTFDNMSNEGMLIDSCRKLNLPVVNLGEPKLFEDLKSSYVVTDNWRSISEKATHAAGLKGGFLFMHKLFAVYHYLKNNKTKKYVSFFDQSDTLLVDSPSERLDQFKDQGCNMLFNAETKCMYWPMAVRTAPIYPEVGKYLINYGDLKRFEENTYHDCAVSNSHKFCYLNSGGFITERDYYVSFFEKYLNFMLEFIHLYDQTVMHHFHFLYYPEIKVDRKCEIFQCAGPNKIEFKL
tara:strand:- start:1992 stop:2828 length:837 start_codon:yes stop_codon:yes gene_type:complete